ncbi:MAG TPA: homoserine kinase [Anaerolineales bacterium]|jgi:homoserine kinase|nr:homoserine kinase [Anaerolineales bacterium]
MHITIRVPATSANLGPGFDSLGLALDLWNETIFTLAIEYSVQIHGEGRERISAGENNLIIRSAQRLAESVGKRLPPFHVDCVNRIPLSSGLGSSAAAKLTGLLGANALLGKPLSKNEILDLATEMEGHADNVAPAMLGGLVVSIVENGKVFAHKVSLEEKSDSPICITVVLPDFHLSTQQARAALPEQVTLKDAVHNISRAVMVTEAFRSGNLELLGKAMTDTLHQPYRMWLIPGVREAMDAAKEAGASAAAISGAGPSIIAFSSKRDETIGEAIARAFEQAGHTARIFPLKMSHHGAEATIR